VQNWPVMSPGEKRHTWRRITMDGSAWRFNKYAERALGVLPTNATNPSSSTTPEPASPPADAPAK